MAEEKKEKKDSHGSGFGGLEIVIGVFILFFLLTAVFQNFGGKIRGAEEGSVLGDFKFLFNKTEDTITGTESFLKAGDRVKNSRPSILYSAPGGAPQKGIGEGEEGVIIEGPVDSGGSVWWGVRYNDGSFGWVSGNPISSIERGQQKDKGFSGPLGRFYNSLQIVSTIISFIFLIGISYSSIRLFQIRREENVVLKGDGVFFGEKNSSQTAFSGGASGRLKWEVVEKHLNSESENDWRLAILEADIMLDQLLRSRGFVGENLGEMLKGSNKGDFQTLDQAWEAHKIRNTIAHEGINYALSAREARRIIGLFEEVFREFDYI